MDFLTGVEILVTSDGTTVFLSQDTLNLFDHHISGDEIVVAGTRKDKFECIDDYQPPVTELGIIFISLRDQVDLGTNTGRLMLQIIDAFREFEAPLIKERVTAGGRAKIAITGNL